MDKDTKKSIFSFIKFVVVIVLLVFSFLFGLSLNLGINKPNVNNQDPELPKIVNQEAIPDFLKEDVDFNLFWDVWEIINDNYVKQPVNQAQLLYGAMAGSIASLGDPHSVFFDPQTTQEFNEELGGMFEGIGAEIAIKNDRLTIVAPLPGSPAEKAGLKAGDKVYAIDELDTTNISLDYAVSKIRGPKGTEVILTISHDGLSDLEEVKIIRNTIKIQSISWTELDNNIIRFEVRYFNEDTLDDFNQAVLDIAAKNPRGIILDLRNNPGGLLDTAIEVASEWVESGPVVFERLSDGQIKTHKARGRARLKDFKTIVLINEGSASGSEIVAGALKDLGLAQLIGETTFGKGTVQSLFPLDDGSSIKITIAEWLTPNENIIEGDGIEPDIKIELTEEDFNNDNDPQLDKAIEILTQ